MPFTLRIPLLPASRILKNCIITKLTYRALNKHCTTIIFSPLPQSATSFAPREIFEMSTSWMNAKTSIDIYLHLRSTLTGALHFRCTRIIFIGLVACLNLSCVCMWVSELWMGHCKAYGQLTCCSLNSARTRENNNLVDHLTSLWLIQMTFGTAMGDDNNYQSVE